VLVFRGQKLSDDHLLAFSKHFGTLDPPPNQGAGRKSPPGYPDIYVVSNVLDDYGEPIGALGDGEAAWHTDMSYIAWPPDASMLYSLEIPPSGGDTSFCSMRVALKKLPRALLERVRHLDIKHDGTYDSGGNLRKGIAASNDPRSSPGTPHPIVIAHPESGEQALYLGRRRNAYIVGCRSRNPSGCSTRSGPTPSRRVSPQVGDRRPRAVGQPHHHAPARCLRSEVAARHAPHADQGLARPQARRVVGAPKQPRVACRCRRVSYGAVLGLNERPQGTGSCPPMTRGPQLMLGCAKPPCIAARSLGSVKIVVQ
jgi:hypothetical protein